MQAVIMAAGKSTRMYPITLTQPKPLVRIANKPILAHQLDQLVGLVNEVILIVGYRSQMIQDEFGYSYRGIGLGYIQQEEQLGTGHAAMQAKPYIRGRFLLMNGDDLYARKDIEACLQYPYTALAKEVPDPSKFSVITVENGLVRDIIEKPENPTSNLTGVGMFVMDTKIFGILENIPKSPRGEYELPDAVKRLAQLVDVHCQQVTHYWIPVGYPWHVLNANDFLLEHSFGEEVSKGKIESKVSIQGKVMVDEQSVIRQGTSIRGNVTIGRHCIIEPNCALIGNVAIGDHCYIGHGTIINNSVIDRQCRIDPLCHLAHSVIDRQVSVGSGTVTMYAPLETKTVTSVIKGQPVASDRKYLGMTAGSQVTIQPNAVFFPGVKIAPETHISAGEIIKNDLM